MGIYRSGWRGIESNQLLSGKNEEIPNRNARLRFLSSLENVLVRGESQKARDWPRPNFEKAEARKKRGGKRKRPDTNG